MIYFEQIFEFSRFIWRYWRRWKFKYVFKMPPIFSDLCTSAILVWTICFKDPRNRQKNCQNWKNWKIILMIRNHSKMNCVNFLLCFMSFCMHIFANDQFLVCSYAGKSCPKWKLFTSIFVTFSKLTLKLLNLNSLNGAKHSLSIFCFEKIWGRGSNVQFRGV